MPLVVGCSTGSALPSAGDWVVVFSSLTGSGGERLGAVLPLVRCCELERGTLIGTGAGR